MIYAKAALLIAVIGPVTGLAQDKLGIDLTDDSEKKEQKEKQYKPEPKKEAAVAPNTRGDTNVPLEHEVIAEDRVKAVQRKVYLKKHRFELTPFVNVAITDPYYSKLGASLALGYYFADTLAVVARGSFIQVASTEDVRTAKRAFQSRIFYSVPEWSGMGEFQWSPIYGKVTIFNSILHFDSYILGGLGVVYTETSAAKGRGPNPGFDLGIGMKFVAKDYLAVNVALINTTYVDTPSGTQKGSTQSLMMLNAGLSVFFPFKSTGRESE